MGYFPTPDNYPDIYWLGCGTYDEKTVKFESEYGFVPQEGQTTDELVQEVEDAGYPVPPKPSTDVCSLSPEEKRSLMASLLKSLENNTCEECKAEIHKQIKELLMCPNNTIALKSELGGMTNG